MATLSNLLRYVSPTKLRLHQRRISIRHVLLTLGISAILSTVYYTWLRRDEIFFPTDDIAFSSPRTPEIWAERAVQVKEAFRHAYRGYEEHAFPHDELLPVSNKSIDK